MKSLFAPLYWTAVAACLMHQADAASLTLSAFSGTTNALDQGELTSLTPDSDTGTIGDVLTINSGASPTTGSGNNGGNSNTAFQFVNSGFGFDAQLTLGAGEVLDSANSFITVSPGSFDDGFLVELNDTPILSFNQFDWQGSDIQSAFGGGWTPWNGEGSPQLLLGDGTLQLLATATSNGSGSLTGITTGDTFDILPAMNSISGDFVYNAAPSLDLITGYSFEVYTANHSGPWSISSVGVDLTATIIPEPSRALIAAIGLFATIGYRRRRS